MKKIGKEKLESIILAVACLTAFVAMYKFFGFFYGINDDISMQKIAAGTSGAGIPDGHLIFVKYAIGAVIAFFFKVFPGLDWYGLFMVGSIFLCGYLIINRIFKLTQDNINKIWIRIIGIGIVSFFVIDAGILFQFTVVAGALAATAVFLVASSRALKISDYVVAWILIVVSALIRLKVFYMTLPLAGLITLGKYFASLKMEEGIWPQNIKQWFECIKNTRALLVKLIIVSILGLGTLYTLAYVVEDMAYSKAPWDKYVEYKHARSQIMDYYKWPEYESNKDFWDGIGISKEEHACLKLYGVLPNVDSDTIIEIANYAEKSYYVSKEDHISNMKSVLKTAINSKSCRSAHIILVFSFLILLIYLFKANWPRRLCIMAGILGEILILLYLLYGGRFPARIITIYDYQCIFAIWGVVFSDIHREKKYEKVLYIACALLLVGVALYTANDMRGKVAKQRENLDTYLKQMEYAKEYPDYFFVVPTGTLVTTKQFTIKENNISAPNMSGTYGWSIFSPWSDKRFEDYGLHHGEHIILQPNVCMFTTNLLYADDLNKYYLSEGWIDKDYEIIDNRFVAKDSEVVIVKWVASDMLK